MKRRLSYRNLLLILIFTLLSGVSFLVWRDFRGAVPEKLIEALPDNVDIALDNVDYTETRGEQPYWRLQADSVAHQAGVKEARLENVRMVFYNQGTYGDVRLSAQRGTWFTATGNVELGGDVVIESDAGQSLYCQQLFYDNANEQIRSDSAVRLVGKDIVVTGRGLQVGLQQQRLVILDQVTSRLADW